MLNNSFSPYLIPNPVMGQPIVNRQTLGLSQIDGFEPVGSFTDDNNISWSLVKSAFDSATDIPDPKSIQIVDYWNHIFPNLEEKIYVYVVEGIKQPRVETEHPTRVMYQWFSTNCVTNFTPQMITEQEWRKANVYAAPIINSRVSKLNAICKTEPVESTAPTNDLIKVKGINNGTTVVTANTRASEPNKPNTTGKV